MDMSPQEYQAYIKQKSPRSPIVKDTALAFLIGGAICVLGQLILDGYRSLGLDKTDAGTATSVTLIFLAALTTGLNLYNSLARFAGAGTLVPITGFANSVVSPAIDFKAEGIITGMAAKMFVIAGPVIVFGTLATAVAAWLTMKMPRWYLAALPPILVNLLVLPPIWAWTYVGAVNGAFWANWAWNCLTFAIGEAVVCYVLGTLLLNALPRIPYFRPILRAQVKG
mgnify:CR=1 FL=1